MAKAQKFRTKPIVKRAPRRSKGNVNDELAKERAVGTILSLHVGQKVSLDTIIEESRTLYNFIKGSEVTIYKDLSHVSIQEPVPATEEDIHQEKTNHRSKFEETHTL